MCYMDDKQLERQMFSLLTWSRSLGGKQSVVFDTEGNDVTKEWEQLKALIATTRVEAYKKGYLAAGIAAEIEDSNDYRDNEENR